MSHEIDQTNGIASFASANTPAWHRLGTVFPSTMTVEQAMDVAHLGGWNVHKVPVTAAITNLSDDGVTTEDILVPGLHTAARTNPITGRVEILGGALGDGYQHLQNEQVAEFAGALIDQSGGAFLDTAGALRGGRSVFYCAKLPQDLLVGGVDPINLFLGVMNSHDGTGALTALVSPVRIVCANTERAAIRNAQQMWKIRHTSGALQTVEEAKKSLNLTWKFAEAFEAEAERMIQETLTVGQFEKIVEGLFPEVTDDEGKRAANNRIERMDVIRGLFTDAETQRNIAGTRWAGYNAVTEWADHFQPVRDKDNADSARAMGALFGTGDQLKAKAFDAFRVPVLATV